MSVEITAGHGEFEFCFLGKRTRLVLSRFMSSPLPSTQIETESAAVQDAEHHRAVLNELIDLGADMALLIRQQTKIQVEPPAIAELSVAFDCIVRCIRSTVLLVAKLAERMTEAIPPGTASWFASTSSVPSRT